MPPVLIAIDSFNVDYVFVLGIGVAVRGVGVVIFIYLTSRKGIEFILQIVHISIFTT